MHFKLLSVWSKQLMQTLTLAMRGSIGVPQMMQNNKMIMLIMQQMMPPQMMQRSWTPTVAMQTGTSIGIPQTMQNNAMLPQMIMHNLNHDMIPMMKMILRRRSI